VLLSVAAAESDFGLVTAELEDVDSEREDIGFIKSFSVVVDSFGKVESVFVFTGAFDEGPDVDSTILIGMRRRRGNVETDNEGAMFTVALTPCLDFPCRSRFSTFSSSCFTDSFAGSSLSASLRSFCASDTLFKAILACPRLNKAFTFDVCSLRTVVQSLSASSFLVSDMQQHD